MHDLVIHASRVLTLAGPKGPRTGKWASEPGIVESGAIAIDDGRISDVGERSSIGKGRQEMEWRGIP